MRNLLLLVGIPGGGKSSWIQTNSLEEYTLSYDALRLKSYGEVYDYKGRPSYKNTLDKNLKSYFDTTLETRMSSGAFTVIDNTNLDSKDHNKYLTLAKTYGYKIYYKKFDIDLATAKTRIQNRSTNYIPTVALNSMYSKYQKLKLPKLFNEITDISDMINITPFDYKGKEIIIVGDIHGCVEELNKFLSTEFSDDKVFIFCGDYIDRGPNSKMVIKALLTLSREHSNVIFLEGNHERWMRYWSVSSMDKIRSNEFKEWTQSNFETPDNLKKSSAREFCRKLRIYSDIITDAGRVLVTHGGVNSIESSNSIYTLKSADAFIKGQGNYRDITKVYKQGSKVYDIIVHGHRNPLKTFKTTSTDGNTEYYNVEGGIECGGELRYIRIKGTTVSEHSIKSTYNYETDVKRLVSELEKSPLIKSTKCLQPNIQSYNFTKEAFFDKKWTKLVCKARGLFINTNSNEIVGRGYSKFFNYKENVFTSEEAIEELSYPLTAYTKANGFLGIIYAKDAENLVYNSKAGDSTDYATIFENIFTSIVSKSKQKELAKVLTMFNVSLTCEVISPSNDPHLTNYGIYDKVILLDLIRNSAIFEKVPFKQFREMTKFLKMDPGNSRPIKRKHCATLIVSKEDLESFIKSKSDILHEGYVFEDDKGFMFKWKSPNYLIKKDLRTYQTSKNKTNFFRSLTNRGIKGVSHTKEDLDRLINYVDSKENPDLGHIDFILKSINETINP